MHACAPPFDGWTSVHCVCVRALAFFLLLFFYFSLHLWLLCPCARLAHTKPIIANMRNVSRRASKFRNFHHHRVVSNGWNSSRLRFVQQRLIIFTVHTKIIRKEYNVRAKLPHTQTACQSKRTGAESTFFVNNRRCPRDYWRNGLAATVCKPTSSPFTKLINFRLAIYLGRRSKISSPHSPD